MKGANSLRKIVLAAINDRPGRMSKVVQRAGGLRRADYADYALAEAHFEGRKKPKRPTSLDD